MKRLVRQHMMMEQHPVLRGIGGRAARGQRPRGRAVRPAVPARGRVQPPRVREPPDLRRCAASISALRGLRRTPRMHGAARRRRRNHEPWKSLSYIAPAPLRPFPNTSRREHRVPTCALARAGYRAQAGPARPRAHRAAPGDPSRLEGQVRPRSGLAMKHGITVLNAPGTIDSDYRGELKVLLVNLGEADFRISTGDRIAQIVFSPVTRVAFHRRQAISETQRGGGGFGSTGHVETRPFSPSP